MLYLERAGFKKFYTHDFITSLLAHLRWTQLELDELSQSAVRDAIQHPPAIDQQLSEQKTGKSQHGNYYRNDTGHGRPSLLIPEIRSVLSKDGLCRLLKHVTH